MSLEVIRIEDSIQWDNIVKSFENYDVYYLSGYVKAFELHGDGKPLLIYYEKGSSKAMQVVMKRDIAEVPALSGRVEPGELYDFASPYGYGGFIWNGISNWNDLNRDYTEYCRNNKIISEFIRFHPVINNAHGAEHMYEIINCGATIAMCLTSPEIIWNNLTSENRNQIRKAQKNDVLIEYSSLKEVLEEFKILYNGTMQRDNANSYYFFKNDFYDSISRDLHRNYTVFYASVNNLMIAAAIILFANKHIHYHLSGSLLEYRSLCPTNFLLYEAALWGCNNGYRTFHLGGGLGGKKDNLFNFKKAFNKHEMLGFYTGCKIYDLDIYNKLTKYRTENSEFNSKNIYFPLYRA